MTRTSFYTVVGKKPPKTYWDSKISQECFLVRKVRWFITRHKPQVSSISRLLGRLEFAKQETGKDVGQMSVERWNKDQPLSKYAEKKTQAGHQSNRYSGIDWSIDFILCWQTPSALLKLFRINRWKILKWQSQSPDHILTEDKFHPMRTRPKAERCKEYTKCALVCGCLFHKALRLTCVCPFIFIFLNHQTSGTAGWS